LGDTWRSSATCAVRRYLGSIGVGTGEATLDPNHPRVATWRGNLGSVLQDLGDLQGARVQLELAVEIAEAALGLDHPTVTTIRGHLNSVRQALQEATPEGPASAG
jgi:hypothetical protein